VKVRVGTAGWAIPRDLRDRFEGEGSVLERFDRLLSTVEINSSFYRPHLRKTYERWAGSVNRAFRFAVKAPKAVTHQARLIDVQAPLLAFLDQVIGLGPNLGPILLQCPPSLAFDEAALSAVIDTIHSVVDLQITCELRHVS
jgi:uncharacterized protein YecE (DUF72 family)